MITMMRSHDDHHDGDKDKDEEEEEEEEEEGCCCCCSLWLLLLLLLLPAAAAAAAAAAVAVAVVGVIMYGSSHARTRPPITRMQAPCFVLNRNLCQALRSSTSFWPPFVPQAEADQSLLPEAAWGSIAEAREVSLHPERYEKEYDMPRFHVPTCRHLLVTVRRRGRDSGPPWGCAGLGF